MAAKLRPYIKNLALTFKYISHSLKNAIKVLRTICLTPQNRFYAIIDNSLLTTKIMSAGRFSDPKVKQCGCGELPKFKIL